MSQVSQASKIRTGKMMEMRDNGHSLREIGEAFCVSKQRVDQLIGPTGEVFIERKRERFDKTIRETLHMPATVVAKETNIPLSAVYNSRKRQGFPTKTDNDNWRFWQAVNPRASDECWVWGGYIDPSGYGKFRLGKKSEYAHRAAWLLSGGDIPTGKHVLHTCDNPSCINLSHLYIGTHQDNMRDRDGKWRTLTCSWCGDEVTLQGSPLKKYCSDKCKKARDAHYARNKYEMALAKNQKIV